jgi:hypothetical protein
MKFISYAFISLVTSYVVSMKFRRFFIIKQNITVPKNTNKSPFKYHSSLTRVEIEKLDFFLNYSAAHL